MRAIKWAALILGAILALAVIAAAILVATFDANRHKDTLVALVHERTGRTLSIDGDIGLSLFPRLALSVHDVRLSGPDGKSEFAAVDAVDLAVEVMPLLHGELRVDQVRAERPVVRYIRDQAGRSSFDGLGVPPPAGADDRGTEAAGNADQGGGGLAFDLRGIEVVDGRLIVRDALAGRNGEVAGVSLSLGHLAPGRRAPWSLAGRFDFSRPAAQGKVDVAGGLLFEGSKVAVDGLKLRLDLLPPQGKGEGLRLDAGGDVVHDGAAGTTTLALAGALDGAAFKARVEQGADAPLKFELGAAKLDVDRLLALAAAPPAAAPGGARGEPAAQGDSQAVDLSFARGLRLDGRVRIDQLRAAGLSLTGLDATLHGDGKALAIAPLAARGYGGRVAGSVRIDGMANGLAVRQTFTDLAVGDVLRDLTGKDLLDGRGNLRLDLDTHGATVGALKRALAGSAALSLRHGAVKGFDLGRLLREGQTLLAGGSLSGGEVGPVFNPADRTEIAELDGTFHIAGGVARNDDLDARNGLMRLRGAGAVDIAGDRLDYTVRAAVADTPQAAQLDKLRGVAVPVRVSGPLEAPAARVLWSEVAGDVARRALAERLQKSLDGGKKGKAAPATPEDAAKEELGRRLRDLLR